MTSIHRLLALSVLSLVAIAGPVWSEDYVSSMQSALTALEQGRYDSAAENAEKALMQSESALLPHSVLGAVYMQTGRLPAAEKEFGVVLSHDKADWQANYALAVILTANGRHAEAAKRLDIAAKSPKGKQEVAAYRRYLASLNGKPASGEGGTLPLALEIDAMSALKKGDKARAGQLLAQVCQAPCTAGFEENRGPVASFIPWKPILLPTGALAWKPMVARKAATVSGTVNLNANVSKVKGVEFISLYVDDAFVGATNCQPPQFEWNSRDYANGYHKLMIEGQDKAGATLSVKTIWVKVRNVNPSTNSGGAVEAALYDRLARSIVLSESRALAHYTLANLRLQAGDAANAVKHLEFCVAYQPAFKDAMPLLKKLGGRGSGYTEVERGPVGGKRIALTFDDGPNERTQQMLGVLRELDVRGTFFLVGMVAETLPDLVKAIVDGGHEVENHSYTHTRLNTLSSAEVERELAKGAAVVRAMTGKPSLYFRPPGGHSSDATRQAAARQGLTAVYWTLLCSPYEDGPKVDDFAQYVISNATDGAIVLMHNGDPQAMSSLPRIVQELRKQGYTFVTLSELLAKPSAAGAGSR